VYIYAYISNIYQANQSRVSDMLHPLAPSNFSNILFIGKVEKEDRGMINV